MLLVATTVLLHSAFSQTAFTAGGKVLDSATHQPLAGASVFCQNTTLGAVTNSEGVFALRLPGGGYNLVVSYTGYDTRQEQITSANATGLTIALKTTDNSLSEVTVAGSSEVADGFAKYGQFFIRNFIGATPDAEQCIIQNPQALQFFYSKKRNRLKVKGKEDLIIMNNALGYKIKYQLDSFSYEYGINASTYGGSPFYELLSGTEAQEKKWKQNRLAAYKGSRLHFIRSWYDSTLQEEGFSIEQVDPAKKTTGARLIINPYDSAHYTAADNGEVEINWPGTWQIRYANELPDKNFLVQYKLPLNLRSQLTILTIADAFVIEPNGYFYDQSDIINSGYWSWEKVAMALPYDYNPDR